MIETAQYHQEKFHLSNQIDRKVANRVGLNGNVTGVQELYSGMSGAKVLEVQTTNKGTIIIKHNKENPEKIHRELDGYELLRGTPLESHVPIPKTFSIKEGFLVMPEAPGVQMREGLKSGKIPEDVAKKVFAELLSVKKEWWATQPVIYPDGDLMSMQRSEWPDTVQKFPVALAHLSGNFNIPIENLWSSPIVYQGELYPPVRELAAFTAEQLKEHPSQLKMVHGDATGGNIIVNSENGDWKLIDAEWTGPGDPAEAYVRMVKQVSTTTVQRINHMNAAVKDNRIHLNMDVTVPQIAQELQEYGKSMIPVFGMALNDPEFSARVSKAITGSYLRELALTTKRGDPDLAFFAIIKAGEQYKQNI